MQTIAILMTSYIDQFEFQVDRIYYIVLGHIDSVFSEKLWDDDDHDDNYINEK